MATIEERAERIIDFWLNDKTPDFKIKSNIRREIAAAIEEEREACAKIADEEADDSEALESHSRKNERYETAGWARSAAKESRKIAAAIRARSKT